MAEPGSGQPSLVRAVQGRGQLGSQLPGRAVPALITAMLLPGCN